MAAMITIAPVRGSEVSGVQVEATHRLLGDTVTHSWRAKEHGAAWIVSTMAYQAAGLREQLRIIWEGEPAEVQWWSPMPAPDAVNVPAQLCAAGGSMAT